ncbi:MAG: peptidase [Acidobacteria bacterium]|nr:MAG: peptidase [Acidobacteriota bacterium]
MPSPEAALTKSIRSYGTWESPVTPALAASSSARLGEVRFGDALLTWVESRPNEGGRNVISGATVLSTVERQRPRELIGESENARNLVHEYGGGSYDIAGSRLAYVNCADSRVYLRDLDDQSCPPISLTPSTARPHALRFADLTFDATGDRIWCVHEIHDDDGSVRNLIAAITLDQVPTLTTATSGADFYAYPRPSPDGRHLAWTSWNQPNMPWDGTELWVAQIEESGNLANPVKVAGSRHESIFQPSWSPAGDLVFVSDATGWWNLYRASGPDFDAVEALFETEAEFGEPLWQFGTSTYAFLAPDRIIAVCRVSGTQTLLELDLSTGSAREVRTRYSSFNSIASDGCGRVAFVGGRPDSHAEVAVLQGDEQIASFGSGGLDLGEEAISLPVQIEFPTTGGDKAFAWYYAPKSPDFEAPEDELPPLITMSHGGPTAATSTDFRADIQFWTTRGFAVVDVDYRGSTGYGRTYRERLNGMWGVYDVDDCAAAAQYLATERLADPGRLAIRGRSAGGFTTLCALTFRDVFVVGASYYGIADAEVLAKETHKFEARYLDGLIGPYPEATEIYRQRSPIYSATDLSCPVIFFQGLEDKVVPPDQAEMMIEAMKARGIRYSYVTFPDEQHGFRRASNIEKSLATELEFFAEVFGLQLGR